MESVLREIANASTNRRYVKQWLLRILINKQLSTDKPKYSCRSLWYQVSLTFWTEQSLTSHVSVPRSSQSNSKTKDLEEWCIKIDILRTVTDRLVICLTRLLLVSQGISFILVVLHQIPWHLSKFHLSFFCILFFKFVVIYSLRTKYFNGNYILNLKSDVL